MLRRGESRRTEAVSLQSVLDVLADFDQFDGEGPHMTEQGPPPTGGRKTLSELWNGLSAFMQALTALITLIIVAAGGLALGHGTSSPSPQPTVTVTVTSTASAPGTTGASSPPGGTSTTGTPSPSASEPVYWHGTVGITEPGLDFDIKPPTSSSNPTVDYNGLHLGAGSSAVVSWWNQPGKPSQSQCQNWVTTHPNSGVDTVSPGMQICIKTALGRYARLTIDPGENNGQLQATATIWGS
jgi:hypothetical protein